jgi:hypothetical protein
MRTKEDNLLKIAESYREDLMNNDEYEDISEEDLKKVFSTIMKDYKRMIKKCSLEGIDAVDTESDSYIDEFKNCCVEEKEDLINRIKDRIGFLIDACETVPEDIEEKYSVEKDLVSMMEEQEY